MLSVPGKSAAGGRAMVFAPDGKPLAEYLPEDQEGLVLADIDLGALYAAKTAGDTLGHWARPDVVRLMVDLSPKPRVVTFGGALAPVDEAAS
jgi:aliphatic nitrilase